MGIPKVVEATRRVVGGIGLPLRHQEEAPFLQECLLYFQPQDSLLPNRSLLRLCIFKVGKVLVAKAPLDVILEPLLERVFVLRAGRGEKDQRGNEQSREKQEHGYQVVYAISHG